MAAALESLGAKTFTLVGHSLGAPNVLHFMRDHAANFDVQAVVLIAGGNPVARPAPSPEEASRLEETMSQPPANDEATRRALWEPDHVGLSLDIRDALWRDIQNNPKERAIGQMLFARADLTSVLASMTPPTLVVSGDADQVIAIEGTLQGFLHLPVERRHLTVFHGGGHYPNAQVPVPTR